MTAAAVEKQLDRLRKTLPQGVPVELAADLIRKHYLLAEIRAEPGSSTEQARRLASQIVDAMRAARNGTCIGFSGGGGEPFRAFIPAGDWPDGDADLRKRLAEVAHVKVRVCEVGERPPFPVRVTLSGPDRSELRRWAEAVAARVAAEQTVLDPDVTPSADQPRVKFDIDADAAKRLGLDSREIMKALRLASGSAAALRFAGGQRMNVRLGAPRGPAELLPGLHVRNVNGELVPLGAVAIAKAAYEPVILLRFGTSPAVRVTGAPPSGATAAAASATLLGVATAERERLKLAADYQAAAAN